MSKLSRITQKIFGSNSPTGGVGTGMLVTIGSLAANAPATTTDPTVMQSLTNFLTGLSGIVMGGNSPALEDLNTLFYLAFRQIAYNMQSGVPEYDAGTTYYAGSYCSSAGVLYVSLTDTNLGNALTDITNWTPASTGANALLNGAFDWWQRTTSVNVANGASGYTCDRWYAKNSLGTNGVMTVARVSGSVNGSVYGASVKVGTAPTAAQANGCEFYQTLSNVNSLSFYNRSACFSAQLKALGNVTAVGIQLYCKTTEAKVDTAIGSEVIVPVTTGAFALGSIINQAIGTTMTQAGVVGVRIRISTVSSGNTYDINNGFIVEQAMLVPGPAPVPFKRAFSHNMDELRACQAYYETSFDVTGATPGTSGNPAILMTGIACAATTTMEVQAFFKATKRNASPTAAITDNAGNAGKVGFLNATAVTTNNQAIIGSAVASSQSILVQAQPGTSYVGFLYNWTADAEI